MEAAGLPELWLVDTIARSVLVVRRSRTGAARFDVELELSGEDVLESPLLPGFAVAVERLFRRVQSRPRLHAELTDSTGGSRVATVDQVSPAFAEPNTSPEVAPK